MSISVPDPYLPVVGPGRQQLPSRIRNQDTLPVRHLARMPGIIAAGQEIGKGGGKGYFISLLKLASSGCFHLPAKPDIAGSDTHRIDLVPAGKGGDKDRLPLHVGLGKGQEQANRGGKGTD